MRFFFFYNLSLIKLFTLLLHKKGYKVYIFIVVQQHVL